MRCVLPVKEKESLSKNRQNNRSRGAATRPYIDFMAATRYGKIFHEGVSASQNYIKFASKAERDTFQEEFEQYHASHEHEGPPPTFTEVPASECSATWMRCVNYDRNWMTIDGYTVSEIRDYHEDNRMSGTTYYQPPTCCVSPIIVIENAFYNSGALERHELSAVFGNIGDDEFESLKESIRKTGFTDNLIRLYEQKILDGWNRFRAAKELNLVRKLRFTEWDTEKEGAPADFVLARNIERRHLTPGQRAQIVVNFSDMQGMGRPKSPSNDELNSETKTRSQLAQEAGVGEATIDRAKQVEKLGQSEAVIAGEKSATEVIQESKSQQERDAERMLKQKKGILKNLWDWRQQAAAAYMENEFLVQQFTLDELKQAFACHGDNEIFRLSIHSAFERTSRATLDIVVSDALAADVSVEQLGEEAALMRDFMADMGQPAKAEWLQELLNAKKAETAAAEERTKAELLASNREKAQAAEVEMWKAFEASELSQYMDKDDLCEEIAKNIECTAEFPDPMEMQNPGHWILRFEGVRHTLEMEIGWVKELLDGFRTDIETGDADPVETQDTEPEPPASTQTDNTEPEPAHLIKFIEIGFDYPSKYMHDNVLCFENDGADGDFALTEIPEEIILGLWDVLKRVDFPEAAEKTT